MTQHLVLAGGGHAHLQTLLELKDFTDQGVKVTVVSPSAYHYYSGMGPGMLSGRYRPEEIRFHIKKMAVDRGADFIDASVEKILPDQRTLLLSRNLRLSYDLLSLNLGSSVKSSLSMDNRATVFQVKPIADLFRLRQTVLTRLESGEPHLGVIGGGPAGLEIICALWRLAHEKRRPCLLTIFAGSRLLPRLPSSARKKVTSSLRSRGIRIVEGSRVTAIGAESVTLENGETADCDLAVLATGISPSQVIGASGLPTGDDGSMLVDDHLRCIGYPEIFGGGDCIRPAAGALDKVGVFAVRENPVLKQNLMASLQGGPLETFAPQKHYMLIFNLGNNTGLYLRNGRSFKSPIAFWLKNYIDKKFVRRFQVSGETGL